MPSPSPRPRIVIVTPAPAGSTAGNRRTALRWAGLLRSLGARVSIEVQWTGASCDLLIAIHARRSAASVARFARSHPERPCIVALAGTDLYGDLHDRRRRGKVLSVLGSARRLVVLQPQARLELPPSLRARARVIFQSPDVPRGRGHPLPRSDSFDVCVLGHLRPVKDPLRAARASRLLPSRSRVRILQIGGALSGTIKRAALAEMARNARYRWIGERSHVAALARLAQCRLLALTSLQEGGAHAVIEAIALGVPVVSSRIGGSTGLLGARYPGYYPPGETRALARLLDRAESDPVFLERLRRGCAARAPLFTRVRERQAWAALLKELDIL